MSQNLLSLPEQGTSSKTTSNLPLNRLSANLLEWNWIFWKPFLRNRSLALRRVSALTSWRKIWPVCSSAHLHSLCNSQRFPAGASTKVEDGSPWLIRQPARRLGNTGTLTPRLVSQSILSGTRPNRKGYSRELTGGFDRKLITLGSLREFWTWNLWFNINDLRS
jgi:hypothetical protein